MVYLEDIVFGILAVAERVVAWYGKVGADGVVGVVEDYLVSKETGGNDRRKTERE